MMAQKCLCCSNWRRSDEETLRSKRIDKEIQRDKRANRREVKLLLLGAGESGKSTFLKQMKIIHGYSFDERLLEEYKTTIYSNILKGMRVLVDARNKLGIDWGIPKNTIHGERVFNFDTYIPLNTSHFLEYSNAVKILWADRAIRTAYERRREFQLVSLHLIINR